MKRAQLYTLRYRKYDFILDTKYIPTINDHNLSRNGNHFSITSVTGIKRFAESFKPMLEKPQTPQSRKLKNYTITSLTLTLKIMDQNNNIITDGPETTVVLHI